jgi:long-subunit fatty acid transport protein
MVCLKKAQFTSGSEMINFNTKFTGSAQTVLGGDTNHGKVSDSSSGGRKNNMVPNIHFVIPLTDRIYYGAGLSVSFASSIYEHT